MSSSVESTKIDLMDDEKTVIKKINKAECVPGDTNNGIMAILKYLIFILKESNNTKFIVNRSDKFGGNLEYDNYEAVEKDFKNKTLHPLDLKNAVAEEINSLLKNFRNNSKLKDLHSKAYS